MLKKLLLVGFSLGLANADSMIDGSDMKGFYYPEVVFIQSNTPPHATVCLAIVYNSVKVFTAETCPLTGSPSSYRILTSDLNTKNVTEKTKFSLVNISTFGMEEDPPTSKTKILHVTPPFSLPADAAAANYITDWEEWMDMIGANKSDGGVVMASTLPLKAASVQFKKPDDPKCNSSYNTNRDPKWPKYMPFEEFCVFKGEGIVNLTVRLNLHEFVPGVPCEDSIGSPVVVPLNGGKSRVIIGMITATKCADNPPWGVALASPEFLPIEPLEITEAEESSFSQWTRPPSTALVPNSPSDDAQQQGFSAQPPAINVHLPGSVIFASLYLGLR